MTDFNLNIIPEGSHSFEVFYIHDNELSKTGIEAFIGFKLKNNDFHFIGVEYSGDKHKYKYNSPPKDSEWIY